MASWRRYSRRGHRRYLTSQLALLSCLPTERALPGEVGMRKISILVVPLLVGALVLAQTSAPSQSYPSTPQTQGQSNSASVSGSKEVAAGTEIMAALDQPLSTKNSKVVDTFTATVQQNLTALDVSVAVPTGSKIQGDVVQSYQCKTLPIVLGKAQLN